MILQSLSLDNFKNIEQARLEFSPKLNCFLGNNGMGKSNLLDAIYLLSFCKSFTGVTDPMLIRNGEDFSIIRGHYLRKEAEEELTAGLRRGRRKSFKRGAKEYVRLSEHIGTFPLVMVSPADMDLVNGAAEERRRFMDIPLSQTDAGYLAALIRYNRGLEQRNRLLRDNVTEPALYQALEMMLDADAAYITTARAAHLEQLTADFRHYYAMIAGAGAESDSVALDYGSRILREGATLQQILDNNRNRDHALGYTSSGPHRDDIELSLNGMPVRRVASQGQAKTYTIALRLAQYHFIARATGIKPLLLLDDIFDKLDAERVQRIMVTVAADTFGQIFITDTNRKHLDEITDAAPGLQKMWHVEDGRFAPL